MVANLGFGPTQQDDRELMRMLEARQRQAVPDPSVYAKAMARAESPEGVALQEQMQAARQQAMKPAVSVAGGSTTARPEKSGLLSRLGRSALDYLQDPESRARAAMAFNAMRLQPDPNLSRAMQTRVAGIQERRQQAQQANRTVEYLKNMGRTDLAQAVELNPAMAGEALTLALTPTKGVVLGKDQRYIDPITGKVLFGPEDTAGLTEEQTKQLTDLRKEYTGLPATKDFAKQATAYDRVVQSATDPSAAGDLSLIFNFMKVLDPGSVVRESEFATAAGARAALTRAEGAGTVVPAFVAQAVQRLETGQMLLPEQRNDFLTRAGMLYTGAEEMHQRLRSYYETESLKISPSATLPNFGFLGEVFKAGESTTTVELATPPATWQLGSDAWNALTPEDRKAYLEDDENG